MDEARVTIIGAGVVGLAVAAALSKELDGVVLLERHETFGRETSSRNSEVIHSGIYYPHGSLKAVLCVEGAERLYRYCEANLVPHKRTGKLIIAADESEEGWLNELYETGRLNGAKGIKLIGRDEAARLEPNVIARTAIYSPDTGIVDSHRLMTSLYREAEVNGVMCSFNSEASLIEKKGPGYVIDISGQDYKFFSSVVVNCAGLFSDRVSEMAGIEPDAAGYRLSYCKGSYFSYAGHSPVGRLIYPVPHRGLTGLGVHATLDLAGRLRFGPDAEYVDAIDYSVDSKKRDAFFTGASRIIKGLDRGAFIPDMAGVRPKIKGDGFRDFVIRDEGERGLPGLVSLVGIESPGLTACLAIADYVKRLIKAIL